MPLRCTMPLLVARPDTPTPPASLALTRAHQPHTSLSQSHRRTQHPHLHIPSPRHQPCHNHSTHAPTRTPITTIQSTLPSHKHRGFTLFKTPSKIQEKGLDWWKTTTKDKKKREKGKSRKRGKLSVLLGFFVFLASFFGSCFDSVLV